MNNSECAKKVLDWAVCNAIEASLEYVKADCGLRGNYESIKTWKEHNPDDGVGGFSTNPYERNTNYLTMRVS